MKKRTTGASVPAAALALSAVTLLGAPLIRAGESNSFVWNCVNQEGFQIRYRINPDKKTVFFMSSQSADGKETWNVNKFENIAMWKDSRIVTSDNFESNTSVRTIFLDKSIMLNSAHYPDGNFGNFLFKCSAMN